MENEINALDAELEAAINGETIDADETAEPTEAEKQAKVDAFLERLRKRLQDADPMGAAVTDKARGAVVNGGRKKTEARNLANAYERHRRQMRRNNPRFKLGRYTAPQDRNAPQD